MDAKTFETIKTKIETLKQKKNKAEGAIETIVENWKNTYGFSTIEEAEKMLQEKTDLLNKTETKLEDLYQELKGITNWNLI